MARAEIHRWGEDRIRVRPWRGDPLVAYLAPVPGRSLVSVGSVRRSVEALAARGVTNVFSAAVPPAEEAILSEAGFSVREKLHLLRHDLSGLDDIGHRTKVRLRRSRAGDRREILATDNLAFDEFWAMDSDAFDEAVGATPTSRVRVATVGEPVGFAISGRAGRAGYLQRLAVAPEHQGKGIGRALVVDGLKWMRRWGARHALVNTQVVNDRAYQLYLRLGFVHEPHGLTVLELSLSKSR